MVMPVRLVDGLFAVIAERLERAHTTQGEAVDAAAARILEAVDGGREVLVFGSGHSGLLTQEICVRAGELPFYKPVHVAGLLPTDYPYVRGGLLERVSGIAKAALDSIQVVAGDVMIIASNSGRNAVPIEMAQECRVRGLTVIALTSVEFSSQVSSRQAGGRRLFEVADIVLDNCCPPGDAAVAVPGSPAPMGPLSTIIGSALLHAVSCRVAELMLASGRTPPVVLSANVDGGDEYGLATLDKYSRSWRG